MASKLSRSAGAAFGPAILGSVLLSAAALSAQAVEFGAGLQNTTWELEGDRFACYFRQPIPQYGEAVFHHRAGEDLEFYIETPYNRMRTGYAALAIEAPPWRSSSHVRDLGYVPVRDSGQPLTVETERALAMINGLETGMAPTFTRQGRGMNGPVRLRVSPVGFRSQVDDYRACITGLLPINFDQAERTVVNYDTGVDTLSRAQQARLDNVVTYILNDDNIVAVYVEGHSDNQSTRFDGRRRSERRALRVQDYLVDRGVDPQIILVDYHGDRYPVASNATAEGRAQNRRTTIRLERVDFSLD